MQKSVLGAQYRTLATHLALCQRGDRRPRVLDRPPYPPHRGDAPFFPADARLRLSHPFPFVSQQQIVARALGRCEINPQPQQELEHRLYWPTPQRQELFLKEVGGCGLSPTNMTPNTPSPFAATSSCATSYTPYHGTRGASLQRKRLFPRLKIHMAAWVRGVRVHHRQAACGGCSYASTNRCRMADTTAACWGFYGL